MVRPRRFSVASCALAGALILAMGCSRASRRFEDDSASSGLAGAQMAGASGRDGTQQPDTGGRSVTSGGGGGQTGSAGDGTQDGGGTHTGGQPEATGASDEGGAESGGSDGGSAGTSWIDNDGGAPPVGGTGGDVGSESGGSGGGGGTALPNGSECTSGEQCESSFCADGVCCDAACDGQCESCQESGAVGECQVITGDPLPTRTACAGTAPCKGQCDGTNGKACTSPDSNTVCVEATCSDGEVTSESACNGEGACTTSSSTTCPSSECASDGSARCAVSCTSGSCDEGSYCDSNTGACLPTLDDGEICSADAQCTSGVCADGVCCDEECTGCSACTLALNGQAGGARDGQCLRVVAGKAAPHGACVANPSAPCGQNGMCDGADGCQYPPVNTTCADPLCSESTLTTSACDSAHVCVPKNEPCPNSLVCLSETQCRTGSCSKDEDCAAGYCAGGTCSTTRNIGDECTSAGECPNGYCVDGYCCNERCDGECQRCNQAPGQCRMTTTPRTGCSGTGTCGTKYCDGSHAACVFPGGETPCPDQCNSVWTAVVPWACNGSGACVAGTPDPCDSSQYCSTSTNPNQCTNKLANYSSSCSKDVQCSSKCCTVCVDATTDNNNCGSCGNTCGANRHCQGSCVCDFTMPPACGSTCGSWNFESGPGSTETWAAAMPPDYEATFVLNGAGTPSITSTLPASGNYALMAPISLSNEVWLAVVGVRVCNAGQATNLSGYRVSGSFYITGSPMAATASAALLAWGGPNGFESKSIRDTGLVVNYRYNFSVTLTDTKAIDHIGIQVRPDVSGAWSGTIYVDDVKFF
jgi:hypothetical protein